MISRASATASAFGAKNPRCRAQSERGGSEFCHIMDADEAQRVAQPGGGEVDLRSQAGCRRRPWRHRPSCPQAGRFHAAAQEIPVRAGGVLGGPFHIIHQIRASVTLATIASAPARVPSCSLCFMCTGLVEMKVWMRPRSAWRNASPARSMSLAPARDKPAHHAVLHPAGNFGHRFKVAVRCNRETGLDHIDAMASRISATWIFSSRFMEAPGDCSPSRNVVSKIRTLPPADGSQQLTVSIWLAAKGAAGDALAAPGAASSGKAGAAPRGHDMTHTPLPSDKETA